MNKKTEIIKHQKTKKKKKNDVKRERERGKKQRKRQNPRIAQNLDTFVGPMFANLE